MYRGMKRGEMGERVTELKVSDECVRSVAYGRTVLSVVHLPAALFAWYTGSGTQVLASTAVYSCLGGVHAASE